MNIRLSFLTDKGRVREHNEDNLLVRIQWERPSEDPVSGGPLIDVPSKGCVFAVADGMGGAQAGEVAALVAMNSVDRILDTYVSDPPKEEEIHTMLARVYLHAYASLLGLGEQHPHLRGMGTTLVMGLLVNERLYLSWLGDSRCYLYRKGEGLRQLTKDHSYVQTLVDAGEITQEEAFFHPESNIVTRVLICEEGDDPIPDIAIEPLQDGDRLLFCSDGLNGMLEDRDIALILSMQEDTEACLRQMVDEANERGGKDNITAILVDVIDTSIP